MAATRSLQELQAEIRELRAQVKELELENEELSDRLDQIQSLAEQLQREGAEAFVKSWNDLLLCIESKAHEVGARGA